MIQYCQYANEIQEVDNSDIGIFAYWRHDESLLFLSLLSRIRGVYNENKPLAATNMLHFLYLAGQNAMGGGER